MATAIFVTTDDIQTLTNKVLSGASNTFSNIPSGALPDFILSSTYFSGVGSVGDPLVPIIDTTITDASVVPVTSNAVFDALALKATLISPSFTTPTIGVATATSVNKVTITAPTTSATLTLITGSSLITAGAFATTLTATATTNATLPAGTNTLYSTLSGSITSAQLLASMSDETGTGLNVFATSPLFTTPRLASTSTTGYVWTATDASGNGSFQVAGGGGLTLGETYALSIGAAMP